MNRFLKLTVTPLLALVPLAGCPEPRTVPPQQGAEVDATDKDAVDNRENVSTAIVVGQPIITGKRASDWIKTLEQGDVIERREAVEALRPFAAYAEDPSQPLASEDGDAAVAALAKALKDDDKDVRLMAAHVLGEVGPRAKMAVPSLLEALNDANASVSEAAAGALSKIDPGARENTEAK